MNASLPDGMKVSVDENLEIRLNDPKEVVVYRIGLEMKEKLRRQDEIFNDLESRLHQDTKTSKRRHNLHEKAYREKIERDFDNSEGVKKSNAPAQQNVVEPA